MTTILILIYIRKILITVLLVSTLNNEIINKEHLDNFLIKYSLIVLFIFSFNLYR